MVTAFAVNQLMAAVHGTESIIYTDSVPLNGNDRGWAVLNVHYLFGSAGTLLLSCTPQVSNDGLNWVDAAVAFTANSVAQSSAGPHTLYAAYFRFKLGFAATGSAGQNGFCCFSLTYSFQKA